MFVKLSLFIGVLFVKLSLYSSRNARKQRDCGDSYKDILYEYILMNRKILMFRGSLLGVAPMPCGVKNAHVEAKEREQRIPGEGWG